MQWPRLRGAPPEALPQLALFGIACGLAAGALMIAFRLAVEGVQSLFLAGGNPVHWSTAVRLTLVVLKDIVLSNITVARLVLGSMATPRPAWLEVPLASGHPRVNALFASIITTTPGTVSAVVDEQRHCIWVHALNCDDAQAMIDDMKNRYEAPLMRIFNVHTTGAAA